MLFGDSRKLKYRSEEHETEKTEKGIDGAVTHRSLLYLSSIQ